MFVSPLEFPVWLDQLLERVGHLGKSLNELPVVIHKTKETLQLFLRLRWFPFLQCHVHLRVRFHFSFPNDPAQEGSLGVHEIALAGLALESRVSYSLKDLVQLLQMLLPVVVAIKMSST